MPIFWWYLLKNYLRVLILSVSSFIAILLVSRLQEIAQFASMGAKPLYLVLFTLYQIPYVLPIAIPISCLLSSLILFQRLSQTHELTALRSCGFSLGRILSPLLAASALLSAGTFYITSELATASHGANRKMVNIMLSANPLLLLQNAKIARLQDAYIQMDPVRNGESAKNVVIAMYQAKGERLTLCLIKEIALEKELLKAHDITLLFSLPSKKNFDHLVIENQKLMAASAPDFAKMLTKGGWRVANDHLKWSWLKIRTENYAKRLAAQEPVLKQLRECYTEMVRRLSFGAAPFTFTVLGMAFGMEVGRNRKKKGLLSVLLLSTFCLLCFCMGKTFSQTFWLSTLMLTLPHACTLLAALFTLKRVHRGIE